MSNPPITFPDTELTEDRAVVAPVQDRLFDCIVLSTVPAAVAAAARAGGLGILDLGPLGSGGLEGTSARDALDQLHSLCTGEGRRIGLRFTPEQADLAIPMLATLDPPAHAILAWNGDEAAMAATLGRLSGGPLIVEVPAPAMADRLAKEMGENDAFLAVAAEAGGWAGALSGFLFAQHIAARAAAGEKRAWYLRGAVGPRVAAACWLAGLTGVALADEILMFPESRLAPDIHAALERADMSDYAVLGEPLGLPVRIPLIPACGGAKALAAAAARAETLAEPAERQRIWREHAIAALRWSGPGAAWPVGQGAALSIRLAATHHTVGRLVRALMQTAERSTGEAADAARLLMPGAPLAEADGLRIPVFQGPMTQVSNTPAFVAAVAGGGAGATLALALMSGEAATAALEETRRLCGDRPFGVGLLGFSPPELLAAQMEAIRKVPPAFAVIAGGRAELWRSLTEQGVRGWLHAPTPRLLRLFLEQGVDRFILEGRECGGHVGPCQSFALWEAAISEISALHRPHRRPLHLLFAGGIHDALSAAMVAAMVAPLAAEAGVRIGILTGTAYLATHEAVESGAIVSEFQRRLLAERNTALIVSGPGHANRCLSTPFVAEFNEQRRALIAAGTDTDTTRERLDRLLLGRLRISTKGVARRNGTLTAIDKEQQADEGMFMAGDVAGLLTASRSMAELHDDLTAGAATLLVRRAQHPAAAPKAARPRNVAVVGMALLLPGAADSETYWSNIVAGRSAIGEIPAERWDWRLIFDPKARTGDRTVSKWGGFIEPIEFDPTRYGIPPSTVKATAAAQLLVLEMVQRALADAGYAEGGFDRERTSVVVASADAGGFLANQVTVRSVLPFVAADGAPQALARLPEWREEMFAGTINSVAAGRVANRLDFGGANYTVDSACASGLTALALALDELVAGRSDLVVVAAVDSSQTPFHYMGFSNTGALSATGAVRAFDLGADGTVISEGVVAVVLKRLDDAERDGDRIYGVVRAAANSSDGRSAGLTAPHPVGQRRALRRAYAEAGESPSSLQMYEAHGTGTPVGDRAEFETVAGILAEAGAAPRTCILGSVKSLIGHTKTAAGLASFAKVLLALHHKVQPLHAVATPIEGLAAPSQPMATLARSRPWPLRGGRRLAGASAFGFGGTNCHVLVEGYGRNLQEAARGGPVWPAELMTLQAADADRLASKAAEAARALAGHNLRLRDLAFTLASGPRTEPAAAFLVATDVKDAHDKLEALAAHLREGTPLPGNVTVCLQRPGIPAQVAFLFPGQGVQAPYLAQEAALYLDEVGDTLEAAAATLEGLLPGDLITAIYPEAAYDAETRAAQEAQLTDTRYAQPAIGALSLGLARFLRRLGVIADRVAGHSFGELVALTVAGSFAPEALFTLALARGKAMHAADDGRGGMSVAFAGRETVARLVDRVGGVGVANHNTPEQVVISGSREALDCADALLREGGVRVQRLAVGGAYHSPLMAAARDGLALALEATPITAPVIPVHGNRDGLPYPADATAIRDRVGDHLTQPVEFVRMVETMHAAGTTIFIDVGPGKQAGGLARRILPDGTPVVCLGGDRLSELLAGLGSLWQLGLTLDPARLFDRRAARRLDITGLAAKPHKPGPTTFLLHGFAAEPADRVEPGRSVFPLLTLETAAAERLTTTAPPAAAPLPVPIPPTAPSMDNEMTVSPIPPVPDLQAAFGEDAALVAYREYQQTMRHFLSAQETVMRLFLGAAGTAPAVETRTTPLATVPSPPAPISPAFPAQAATTPAPAKMPIPDPAPAIAMRTVPASKEPTIRLDRAAVEDLLIATVGDVTGYPASMIETGVDIEAELGIDSIKRLEILARLMQRLPAGMADALESATSAIVRQRTLTGWIDALLAAVPAATEPEKAETPSAGQTPPDEPAEPHLPQHRGVTPALPLPHPRRAEQPLCADTARTADACPTYVMRPRSSGLPFARRDRLEGLHLITAGNLPLTRYVEHALRTRGARTMVIAASVLDNPEALSSLLSNARSSHGPVRGILHLAGAQVEALPDNLADWQLNGRRIAKSLSNLLRASLDDLLQIVGDRCGRVLAVSAFGGLFGRDGRLTGSSPLSGAHQGLLRSLALEHPQLMAKCVDLDALLNTDTLALLLTDEYTLWGGRMEIGFPAGRRTVFDVVEAPLSAGDPASPVQALPDDAVILATGGARGITAAIIRRIARAGMRVVLSGRSELPAEEPAGLAALSETAALRTHFIDTALLEGRKLRPAEIETAIRRLRAGREMRATLADLRESGVEAEYAALDVRDAGAVNALVADITTRHGRIDAVLHGAGIIEDSLFADKTSASFDRVFDTKVDGAFNLIAALDLPTLRALAFFGSIAGRFGNRGQADYAAANEVLNRFGLRLKAQWPALSVVVYNWGPWDGVGMAEAAVNAQFRQRGILPITVEAGGSVAASALAATPAVELIAGLGQWSVGDCDEQDFFRSVMQAEA